MPSERAQPSAWRNSRDCEPGKHGTSAFPSEPPRSPVTGIVTNSLFTAYRWLQLDHAFEMCRSAARFVLDDLPQTAIEDGTFCWDTCPATPGVNATMKGFRHGAQVYSVTGNDACLKPAAQTAACVARGRVVRVPCMRWAPADIYLALSMLAYALTNEPAAA